MEFTLKDLLDLGLSGVLVVAVVALWRRLNQLIDAWIGWLMKQAEQGNIAAQKALESSTSIEIQKGNSK